MKLVSHRDVVLADVHGNSISFKKGVPTHVPPRMVEYAMSKGCIPADSEELVVEEAKDETMPAPVGTDRTAVLFDAFRELVRRNNSSDFTAANTPKIGPVRKIVKFDIDPREMKETWHKFDAAMKSVDSQEDISASAE